jgi:hypothetical protein
MASQAFLIWYACQKKNSLSTSTLNVYLADSVIQEIIGSLLAKMLNNPLCVHLYIPSVFDVNQSPSINTTRLPACKQCVGMFCCRGTSCSKGVQLYDEFRQLL